MVPRCSFFLSQAHRLALLTILAAAVSSAQDLKIHVTYVCSGERIFLDSCNMQNTSDTSTCMVAHPDKPLHNGFTVYTYETRGNLKKLLPTCTQPTAAETAKEDAFHKKQQQIIDAQTPKYAPTPQPTVEDVQAQLASGGSKDPQEVAMRRCIAAGRPPSSCTGNALLGSFSNMISSTVSGLLGTSGKTADVAPNAGPDMNGVFQGAGNWRLDFIDGGVLVNCSSLSPNEETYSLAFRNAGVVLTINTTPRPLVLNVHPDGTITGPPGNITLNGVIATGYVDPNAGSGATQKDQYGNLYNAAGQRVAGNANTPGYSTFSKRTATCPAINLTSKGTGPGIQTMQMNVLKTTFGGGSSPATPVGIRMHGIFAASTGFSLQFFPESVILGCGTTSARAYPYTVSASATGGLIKIDAADHPLSVAIRNDGSLDPGSGPYQVHGRMLIGDTIGDSYSFLPLERACTLANLTPAKSIPTTGGTAVNVPLTATH